ncbi:MAG: shikimate dehydrogenase family protein [Eggerthellaceae bacterium]|jgi:shikimate dehydrogenase
MAQPIPISGHTKVVSLIGSPVGHSLSPALHNFAFERLGVDARYFAFDVKPEDLPHVVPAMKALGFAGSNVTMPLKQKIIPFLDEVSDVARLEEAVNVIEFRDGKAIGHNTDGQGFVSNLRKNGCDMKGKVFTLMGAGGAGSAILTQSAADGAEKINLFCRRGGHSWQHMLERVPVIAKETGCNITLHALEDTDDLKACIDESQVLANATNVGMGEGNTDTLVPPEFLRKGLYVADACYFPRMTQLLKDAEAQGAIPVGGLGMMIEQAAAGEKIWFDVETPVDLIRTELFGE